MSKKRKTKKEKIRTAIRQSTQVNSTSPVYSIDTSAAVIAPRPEARVINTSSNRHHYVYVLHDARQTFIITTVLFASSLILYFIVQNHIINLDMFGY